MSENRTIGQISDELIACRRCPRLTAWRERVAEEKRPSFASESYWGKPVPGFGDSRAGVVVVGLAPAAHGANRTGRMFTGDRSGAFLFASLHRTGFANQPDSSHAGDDLTLTGLYITSAVKCAPPGNRPTSEEENNCSAWLLAEMRAMADPEVVVALGGLAFVRLLRIGRSLGWAIESPRPKFGHGAEVEVSPSTTLLASFHPSQQNTFTGRLTPAMMDAVFERARRLIGAD